jgi:hypothetical protein
VLVDPIMRFVLFVLFGDFVFRWSSKTHLTVVCQHVIKCRRSFGNKTPSEQGTEEDEDVSFFNNTRRRSQEKVSSRMLKAEDNIVLTSLVNHTYRSYEHICNFI